MKDFVIINSKQYGKARLVLKNNRYIIEPNDRATKKSILEIPIVKQAYENAIKFNEQEEERKKANLSFE